VKIGAFGIDFGTTNSLAAVVDGGRAISRVDPATSRPHPSVVWYRGGEVVVGRNARDHMDRSEGGAPPGFVRSPKMSLRREGPLLIDGRAIEPTEAVTEVLRHLKRDAAEARGRAEGYDLSRAVMTIPIDFGGRERRALRAAAKRADIGVIQFVHEPVAALYAYLKSREDLERELFRLEGRHVLVFDWGGGTLDVTLCKILGGVIMQMSSVGDNEIGGDRFDERLRNLIRQKHAEQHRLEDVTALEQPGIAAKLLHQCEFAKIELSRPNAVDEAVFIRHYLRTEGPSGTLNVIVGRNELESESADFVRRGMARIDNLLELAGLTYRDIELCLATGGMVNMPAIRAGLTERFLGRAPILENGDRIIAEGAAWIANDGLRLTLSKPIEILVADSSPKGTYHRLIEAGWPLPVENQTQNVSNTRLFCADPREGVATIEFAKPIRVGRATASDPRQTLCTLRVEVDPNAPPLLERLECQLQIDHDYIVHVRLRSSARGSVTEEQFYDLDFGLSLKVDKSRDDSGLDDLGDAEPGSTERMIGALAASNVLQRVNVALPFSDHIETEPLWQIVPGDLVDRWRPSFFADSGRNATRQQKAERDFYKPCVTCGRLLTQILAEGAGPSCSERCFPKPPRLQ
jgi:molecular chaperone DnaK